MKLSRNLAALAVVFVAGACMAQQPSEWPNKPLKIVVSGSAGSAPDGFARYYAEQLTKIFGKPVIVENKPGAAGGLGAAYVAAATDQHTAFWGFASIFSINPHVYPKGAIDVRRDLTPVVATLKQANVLVVNNDFNAMSLGDIVDKARAAPNTVNYASYGVAGQPHLVMELFQERARVRMVHVPYKQQAIVDVISGQVPMVVEPISTAMPLIKAKKVRPVAYTGLQRHPNLPDVPTFSEAVPDMGEIVGTHGLWMPTGTPRDVISRLNAAVNKVTEMPETVKRIADLSCVAFTSTPEQFGAIIDAEYVRWGRVIRERNIKLE